MARPPFLQSCFPLYRKRPDLRRDCDDAQGAFFSASRLVYRKRPDLRRDCDRFISVISITARLSKETWFKKGLRRQPSSRSWPQLDRSKETWFKKGLRRGFPIDFQPPLETYRKRPDLRRDCDRRPRASKKARRRRRSSKETWFKKGLRLASRFHFAPPCRVNRKRPDLRRDCDDNHILFLLRPVIERDLI